MSQENGIHFHKCKRCETIIKHPDSCHGDRAAHTCTNCGNMAWNRYDPTRKEYKDTPMSSCAAAEGREVEQPVDIRDVLEALFD